jgi:hypothetical protein
MKQATIDEMLYVYLKAAYEYKLRNAHIDECFPMMQLWSQTMDELRKTRTFTDEMETMTLNRVFNEGLVNAYQQLGEKDRSVCINEHGEYALAILEEQIAAIEADRKEDRKFRITTYIAIASPFIAVATFLLGYYLGD